MNQILPWGPVVSTFFEERRPQSLSTEFTAPIVSRSCSAVDLNLARPAAFMNLTTHEARGLG